MVKSKDVVYALCLLLLPAAGISQIYEPQKPLSEIESSMEANLTWNLQSALLLYYPENKFVVKADVRLQKVKPKRVLPKLPDALLSRSVNNLPGLPYVPLDFGEATPPQQKRDNLRNYVRENNFQVASIRVNVLVDASLRESDWAFIRRYSALVADLEPTRGDQIRIERLTFPDKATFFAAKQKPEVQQPAKTKPPQQAQIIPSDFDWRPYAFAGGIALLLIIAFFLGIRAITKSIKKSMSKNDAVAAKDQSPLPVSRAAVAKHRQETDQTRGTSETPNYHQLRSEMMDTIVGTPSSAAAVFNQWIEERDEAGTKDVAALLTGVSKPLAELLTPYFGKETAGAVKSKMAEMEKDVPESEVDELIKLFNGDLRKLVVKESKDPKENDALAFLNQMSDNQLEHLLKPLKTGIKAIVLAQMRSNRAAKFLSKMDADEKKEVLVSMGNIEHLPLDVYQHIARQLAARANKLEKMRYVRANGVDAVVKVMEHLDEKTQDDLLNHLQTQDVKLAQKVHQKFMTFNQLLDMPEEEIQKVALEVDREILAKSLVTVDEETVVRIVSALPEKLQELVTASLESNHDIPENEVAQARRALMRSLRESQKQ